MGTAHGLAMLFTTIAIALGIVAISTHHWVDMKATYATTTNENFIGLYEACYSYSFPQTSGCNVITDTGRSTDTICGDHTYGQMYDYFRAMQAMATLSVIVGITAWIIGLIRSICTSRFTTPSVIEGGLTALSVALSLIAWALFTYFVLQWYGCGESYCTIAARGTVAASDFECGFRYSYALSVASTACFLLGSSCFFAGSRA
jgi:hypothetical protein